MLKEVGYVIFFCQLPLLVPVLKQELQCASTSFGHQQVLSTDRFLFHIIIWLFGFVNILNFRSTASSR
jgi:hypothetical protein